jgi:hypothetical protein
VVLAGENRGRSKTNAEKNLNKFFTASIKIPLRNGQACTVGAKQKQTLLQQWN